METKNEIWALTIENKRSANGTQSFEFEPNFAQILLSGLHTIYAEVFVWSVNNRLALWVTGDDASFLMSAFMNHLGQFEKMQLLRGEKAQDHLSNIANGLAWQDCSMNDKLKNFKESYLYAHIHGQLGARLAPLIEENLKTQINNPLIAGWRGTRNSRKENKFNEQNLLVAGIQIESKEKFYRFCLN